MSLGLVLFTANASKRRRRRPGYPPHYDMTQISIELMVDVWMGGWAEVVVSRDAQCWGVGDRGSLFYDDNANISFGLDFPSLRAGEMSDDGFGVLSRSCATGAYFV